MLRLLVDGEAAGRGLLGVSRRKLCVVLLEAGVVKTAGGVGGPTDLERSGRKRFFVAHAGFDLVFQRGDLRLQFLLHAAKLHQFLDFGFHVLVAHVVASFGLGTLLFLIT